MSHREPIVLTAADAGELMSLQRAAIVSELRAHRDLDLPPATETLDEVRAVFDDPMWSVWGIREEGRLVACVRIRDDGDAVWIARLMVAPDRQGEGFGSGLLTAAEARFPAAARRARMSTGSAAEHQLKLYARLGYQETHRIPQSGYDVVYLEKVLEG
ncbi:GNAT family N-acetyltransferase [Amycolatopsis sp. CA-230715]|uniref:GNAT family N-acetyltransferase n=1 Tax=Amycolatopsis sp. CA-230715 TaxID=2745196 RepID=UPI001C343698|nr:GNAT family N-acetyltransferase [Amycolatopsis sp. CA-230715]QWF81747.1 hypothetical protein HUW46_05180 [Amycolatopsis sp. CA-230715]